MTLKEIWRSNDGDDSCEEYNFSDRVYPDYERQDTYGPAAGLGRGSRANSFDPFSTRNGGHRDSYDTLSIPGGTAQYALGRARASPSVRDSFSESGPFRGQSYASHSSHTGPRGSIRPGYPASSHHASPFSRLPSGWNGPFPCNMFSRPDTTLCRDQHYQKGGSYASESDFIIPGRGRGSKQAYPPPSRGRGHTGGQPYQTSQGRRTGYSNIADTSNDGVADYWEEVIGGRRGAFGKVGHSNDYDHPRRPGYQPHGARSRNGSLSPLSRFGHRSHHDRL